MGLIAHTCLEATVRYGVELGYHATVVKDARELLG
jgi:ureidoacrylate peracid hydrolase